MAVWTLSSKVPARQPAERVQSAARRRATPRGDGTRAPPTVDGAVDAVDGGRGGVDVVQRGVERRRWTAVDERMWIGLPVSGQWIVDSGQ